MKINISFFLILIFFLSFFPGVKLNSFLHYNFIEKLSDKEENSEKKFLIENAVYVIRNKIGEKNLEITDTIPYFINNKKKNLKKQFRILAIDKETRKQTFSLNNDNLYCIEDKDRFLRIGLDNDKREIKLFNAPKDKKNEIFNDDNILWRIIPITFEEKYKDKTYQKIYYYLKNVKTGKYLSTKNLNDKEILICDKNSINDFKDNNYFIFIKMYKEPLPNENIDIINKEPIDVLIKYIDLSDPNLKRDGIKQITKDQDNEELRYSVRSILMNIPWVRKIFILMPNERVRYFKPPEEIKDRIVYVKDKDLLGFDSASSVVFQFNLWKMKEFGMSENFILMDDDYFIGKPLKKSNFFYEENGKVYPGLVTRDFYELSKDKLKSALTPLLQKISKIVPHSSEGFSLMQKTTLFLLYDIFGDDYIRNGLPLIEPSFTHNAIPVKQSDIKEIYDLILKYYLYIDETLKSKVREVRSLQPQTLFAAYARNMHDRRVKMISSAFYDLTQFKGVVKDQLFVINVSTRNYAQHYFNNEKKYLENLYPIKSQYEIGGPDIVKSPKKDEENTDNKNEKDDKTNKNTDIIIINKKTDNEIDKKEQYDNQDYFKELIEYLDKKLNEKDQIKNNIIEINNKINKLSEKYDKMEKEIEILSKKINDNLSKNITLNEKSNSRTFLNTKYIHILLLLLILIGFLLYLYKNGYLKPNINNKEVNYMDINSLSEQKNEKEMYLMNSKIDL